MQQTATNQQQKQVAHWLAALGLPQMLKDQDRIKGPNLIVFQHIFMAVLVACRLDRLLPKTSSQIASSTKMYINCTEKRLVQVGAYTNIRLHKRSFDTTCTRTWTSMHFQSHMGLRRYTCMHLQTCTRVHAPLEATSKWLACMCMKIYVLAADERPYQPSIHELAAHPWHYHLLPLGTAFPGSLGTPLLPFDLLFKSFHVLHVVSHLRFHHSAF